MTSTQDSPFHESWHEKQNRLFLIALFVALMTVFVYLPALNNGFVNWDDNTYVYDNVKITSLDLQFIGWAFTTFEAANYHPLTWISYAMDYTFWKMNPFGYHLTNLLIHAANTFLVVVLVTRLFQRADKQPYDASPGRKVLVAAGITGLLFGAHPMHVESVAWVSERKDVLCAFFLLLSLLAYLNYATLQTKKHLSYSVAVGAFILSLLCKPMAVTFPFVLLTLDVYPLKRLFGKGVISPKRVLLEKLPFLGLSLASAVVTIIAQNEAAATIQNFSFFERILTASRALVFYLVKLLLPIGLVHFYPIMTPVSFSIKDVFVIIILSGVTLSCIWPSRRSPIWMTVWIYYLITLMPVLGIVQVGGQAAADRYTYLPALGPMFLIGLGCALVVEKLGAGSHLSRLTARLFVLVLSGLFLLMFSLTIHQIRVWKDSLSLWNREFAVYPVAIPLLYRGRADAYYRAGKFDMAIADFTTALEIDPVDYRSYFARGMIYFASERYEKALADFDRTLAIKPDHGEASLYRSLVYRRMSGAVSGKDKSSGSQ